MSLDVTDAAALDAEVAETDVVVSLIPYTFHADGKIFPLNSAELFESTNWVDLIYWSQLSSLQFGKRRM